MEYHKRYYEENKKKIIEQKKQYRRLTKEARNKCRRRYRKKFLEKTRMMAQINTYRRLQAKLAERRLKINGYKPSTQDIDNSFSTYGLSELLF